MSTQYAAVSGGRKFVGIWWEGLYGRLHEPSPNIPSHGGLELCPASAGGAVATTLLFLTFFFSSVDGSIAVVKGSSILVGGVCSTVVRVCCVTFALVVFPVRWVEVVAFLCSQ